MLDRDAVGVNQSSPLAKPLSSGMAPSPDNDTAPKAPDKSRHDKSKEKSKDDKTLSDLNDGELKGLLDEALNYKNPKDREGKSKLFNHLLNEAEEDERNARAARAGGSELVRYCNPSAKRSSRHRKKPSSVSENMMHGGSLDNLKKEELYETSKHRTKKSVSARQREGGSLPCNVNSSTIISHDYQFLEEARKKKAEKKSNDLEEQSLLDHDSLAQSWPEQPIEISHHYQPKFTTSCKLQVNEVDGPVLFPTLEQVADRKSCSLNKSLTQMSGSDCTTSLKISNDTKVISKIFPSALSNCDRQKVDENANALHQNLVKTKKKKSSDKNVVVCNAENVKGHRSDIINDMDKLMEFIGITDDQTEKNRPIKSKLNRHSSDDAKSKKRAHSSKSKENSRSKLKKSNSLGEISTTNLDDFEFDKDQVVMRNNKSGGDKPRERRSWGNMEPLPIQTLYTNASVENLETAEFRVVTKKKKSKKRRNSISGRTKTSPNPSGKSPARAPSPDLRRKSACSVPHSEKSNDSSDVDSVHSLPIDTQGLDLATARLNMPISYAEMAKNSEKPKEKKISCSDKVPKEQSESVKCVVSNSCDYVKSEETSPSAKSMPPDVHNFKSFPSITKQVAVQVNVVDKTKNSNKVCKSVNQNKNFVKNNMNKGVYIVEQQINYQNELESDDGDVNYSVGLPPDIPDVQTIEKLQLSNCYDTTMISSPLNNGNDDCPIGDCDNVSEERTTSTNSVDSRPPVVILSGYGNSKEVPGLVFGFDINEQLLNEDCSGNDFCCDDFISRYVPPENYTLTSHNHDKIVSYIGAAWEDTVINQSNGRVQYYSELL